MQNYRRNDLLDQLHRRYMRSFNGTIDTIEATGTQMYDFYIKHLTGCFKKDLKVYDKDVKKYNKFLKRKRKHDIKKENIKFREIYESDKKFSVSLKQYLNNRAYAKLLRIDKRFKKVLQKSYLYIPIELYKQEYSRLTEIFREEFLYEEINQETVCQECIEEMQAIQEDCIEESADDQGNCAEEVNEQDSEQNGVKEDTDSEEENDVEDADGDQQEDGEDDCSEEKGSCREKAETKEQQELAEFVKSVKNKSTTY